MNIARRNCTYVLFSVALAVLASGCQGLQGVRYHEGDLAKLAGEGVAAGGEAGFEIGIGESGEVVGDGGAPAPHPRFHPLPTRPVFEPDGVAAVPADDIEEQPLPPTNAVEQVTRSVLNSSDKPRVEQASATPTTLLAQMLPADGSVVEQGAKSGQTGESSRRKVESKPAPAPVLQADDEPPAFEPVKATAPSANDGWHPRVAAP